MSWLLKQAEDILNRVDQQTNAALHQNQQSKTASLQNQVEFIPEPPSFTPSVPSEPPKNDESDLINFLNSPTPVATTTSETKKATRTQTSVDKIRTESSSSNPPDDALSISSRSNHKEFTLTIPLSNEPSIKKPDEEIVTSLQTQIQKLTHEQQQHVNELEVYKRQQIQYQQQIAESDALLRDLRSRESDSMEILLAKDSQINLLRNRLIELDSLLQTKTNQYEQLQNSSTPQSESSELLKHD
ncbi:hypothetical protein I4U23_024706 [Adineta vaga]|nr:hypothetical protein I4U23_024706 [Adineta vaga]